jgi:hypothetical protein
MSVYVVRAFVQLRDLLASSAEFARRLDELEAKLGHHYILLLDLFGISTRFSLLNISFGRIVTFQIDDT